MTRTELENNKNYELHHIASRRGYVSRKSDGIVEHYTGKFGNGYVLVTPRFDTTQYVNVSYYIAKE